MHKHLQPPKLFARKPHASMQPKTGFSQGLDETQFQCWCLWLAKRCSDGMARHISCKASHLVSKQERGGKKQGGWTTQLSRCEEALTIAKCRHCLQRHFWRLRFLPPNLGLSQQKSQRPQSIFSRQASHLPHLRFRRLAEVCCSGWKNTGNQEEPGRLRCKEWAMSNHCGYPKDSENLLWWQVEDSPSKTLKNQPSLFFKQLLPPFKTFYQLIFHRQ